MKNEGLTNCEYIVKKSLQYFGMTKKALKDDALEKILSDEAQSVITDFERGSEFLLVT